MIVLGRWIFAVFTATALVVACGETLSFDESDGGRGASDGGVTGADAFLPDGAGDSGLGDAADLGPCDGACTEGTVCTDFGWCKLETAPSCAKPIDVKGSGGHFRGTICADAGTGTFCSRSAHVHVYSMGRAAADFHVLLGPGRPIPFDTNVVDQSCSTYGGSGCSQTGSGGGTAEGKPAEQGKLYAIGASIDAGCVEYDVTFTPN